METSAPSAHAAVSEKTMSSTGNTLLSRLLPYLLIAPTLILVLLFTVMPSVNTVIDSLYMPGRRPVDPATYVGLENYADLFDPSHYIGSRFSKVLSNTLIFTFATVIISVPLALGFALLLNRRIRLMGLWRFSVVYPSLLPLIGAASIWAFIFSDGVGLANTVLRSFGLPAPNWIGDPNLVLISIIIVNVWKQSGYFMLFYLAGLQNISRDIYESAALDGANGLQSFIHMTLPLLRRTTLFILIIAFTFGFQTVEQLAALGRGNPADRGNLMLYLIFQNIGERRNLGYINAMTVILVGILLVFTVSNFLLFERKETE